MSLKFLHIQTKIAHSYVWNFICVQKMQFNLHLRKIVVLLTPNSLFAPLFYKIVGVYSFSWGKDAHSIKKCDART
jgi:hypothetical protein